MSSPAVYAVIGGEGFLGHHLITALLSRYPSSPVHSLDLTQRYHSTLTSPLPHHFHTIDISSTSSISSIFSSIKPTFVFHVASPHQNATEELCKAVNVIGTKNVVQGCVENGVKGLVYTSSSSVVYDGQNELINVDERVPYPENFADYYGKTKAAGEAIVLGANGKDGLLTCALRPSGIFGPGDMQQSYAYLQALKRGQTNFQIGDNTNIVDWTYVENVAHAHLLAAERLDQTIDPEALSPEGVPMFDVRLGRAGQTAGLEREVPTSQWRPTGPGIPGGAGTPNGSESEKDYTLVNQSGILEKSSTNIGGVGHKEELPLPAARNRFDQFYGYSASYKNRPPRPAGAGPAPVPNSPALSVAGQAYFITNAEPVPFFTNMRSIWKEYNGFTPPFVVKLPSGLGWWIGLGFEFWTWLVGSGDKGKGPGLTRGTVGYCTRSRYFNIEKARIYLGYEPLYGLDEGARRTAEWLRTLETEKTS